MKGQGCQPPGLSSEPGSEGQVVGVGCILRLQRDREKELFKFSFLQLRGMYSHSMKGLR